MIKDNFRLEMRRFLETQPDFGNLPSSEIEKLSGVIKAKKLHAGEWIFDQGEELDHIFFLDKGHVKLYSMDNSGRTKYLSFITPQTVFPLCGILDRQRYDYNAVAIEDVEIFYAPVEEVRRIIIHNYTFTLAFMKRMEQLIYRSEKSLARMTSSSANQRVKRVLEGLIEDYGQLSGGTKRIPFKIYLKDIATLSGTTTETAGTVVKELKKQNKLRYNKKKISFV